MINIDNRLLNDMNGFEISVFLHIIKRINKSNECFPSRSLLQKETGFGREKVASVIKSLVKKGIISIHQENDNGNFGKTIYVINTDLASVYITVKDERLVDESKNICDTDNRDTDNRDTDNRDTDNRDTDNRDTDNRDTEIRILSINHNISINKFKDISPSIKNENFLDVIPLGPNSEEKAIVGETLNPIEAENTIKPNAKTKINHLNIPPQTFYDSEVKAIEKETSKESDAYRALVKFLFGSNDSNINFDGVLGIKNQITFCQFKILMKMIPQGKRFRDYLFTMENDRKYYKNKSSLYLTLRNWINMDINKTFK